MYLRIIAIQLPQILADMNILNEKQLRNGETFTFETIDKDDLRILEVSFKRNHFIFWFNGTIIDSCKTFKTAGTITERLSEKWNLEPSEHENN